MILLVVNDNVVVVVVGGFAVIGVVIADVFVGVVVRPCAGNAVGVAQRDQNRKKKKKKKRKKKKERKNVG